MRGVIRMSVVSLQNLSEQSNVENVVIFISDSTRFDYLPAQVKQLGVTAEAISPSTFTASSLPGILTGTYPATHKVWGFENQLPETPPVLRNAKNSGLNVDNIWSHIDNPQQKPPVRMLRLEKTSDLSDLEQPFTYIVHDKGGHAPYGDSEELNWDTVEDFYERYVSEPQRLIDLYQEGVETSADRFCALRDQIQDRGILDETLLVFTSDHGELLGEPEYGGIFGHGHPLVPELVSVPIVFTGAGLPHGETYDQRLSGTDIVPTVLAAQGRSIPDEVEGVDLWSTPVTSTTNRPIRSDVWKKLSYDAVAQYAVTSLWDDDGGVVRNLGSTFRRCLFGFGTNLYNGSHAQLVRAEMPQKVPALFRAYAGKEFTYGSPEFTDTQIDNNLPSSFSEGTINKQEGNNEMTPDKEQLRKLGYLE